MIYLISYNIMQHIIYISMTIPSNGVYTHKQGDGQRDEDLEKAPFGAHEVQKSAN